MNYENSVELKNLTLTHCALAGAIVIGLVGVPGIHIIAFFSFCFIEVLS